MEVVEITPSRGWGSLVPLDRTTDHTPAEPAVKDASTPLLIPNFETRPGGLSVLARKGSAQPAVSDRGQDIANRSGLSSIWWGCLGRWPGRRRRALFPLCWGGWRLHCLKEMS